MKKIGLFIAAFVFSLGTFAQKYSFDDLVGSWRTKEGAGLEVVDSFNIYIVYQDQKKMLVNYSADFSVNPVRFTFVLKDPSGYTTVKSKLNFVNDDLVQWQLTEEDIKPARFNGLSTTRRDALILRRVEVRSN